MSKERRVTTRDGRTLRVVSGGDADGVPVFGLHGTPSDGSIYPPHEADARARGIHLIEYDRPGYGGSSPAAGRTVADCARDVEAIADALGFERFAVWGISGGGPHALACGALLPERVVAVASLAAIAPADADGLDWLAGMGDDNVEELGAARRGRAALEPYLESARAQMLAGTAEELRDAMPTLLSPVDADALSGELADFLHASMHDALRDGVEGWLEDDLAFVNGWGFDVRDVRVPVLLWQGEHDRFVPPAHGRWLAEHLPAVEAHLSEEDGHLTLTTRRLPEAHAWLLERLQA